MAAPRPVNRTVSGAVPLRVSASSLTQSRVATLGVGVGEGVGLGLGVGVGLGLGGGGGVGVGGSVLKIRLPQRNIMAK